MISALDPFSEVVDKVQRWNPEWYSWVREVTEALNPPLPQNLTGNGVVTGKYVICNQAATTTLSLPSAALFPTREIYIKTIQAQAVNSASPNVAPSTSATMGVAILPAVDGAWALLVSDGSKWVIMAAQPLV